tara:strand:+ start:5518 stop:5814 length:297 start_codon:yes stop_codon:yes gene_type:complete
MRVNVSYSINLEDVPKEVCKILDDTLLELQSALETCQAARSSLNNNGKALLSINNLEEVRLRLATADQRLSESTNILIGYQNVLSERENEEKSKNDEG